MKKNDYSGKLIIFEGLDGSGQTTQAGLLKEWFKKHEQWVYYTKEPTEGPIGAFLRLALAKRLVTSKSNSTKTPEPIDDYTMALAFAADRMDHLNNEIIPKLKDGVHVIMDRYYLSSFAYQALTANYKWLKEINKFALRPDLTIFLDVPPVICKKRMEMQRWHVELYEELPKLELVYQNYKDHILDLKSEREDIHIIDGNLRLQEVHRAVISVVKRFMAKRAQKSSEEQIALPLIKSQPLSAEEIAAQQMG